MNRLHNWYCASGRWAATVRNDLLPWALRDLDLGDDVLEIGPGPGLTTDLLREQAKTLTAVEIDPALAAALRDRFSDGTVTVLTADATDLPLPEDRFSATVSFTMLHHIPTAEMQDQVLAEAHRVLRPGGVFAGSDSTTGPLFRLAHLFDTMVLIDPATFAARLAAAGFVDAHVDRGRHAFRFRARKRR